MGNKPAVLVSACLLGRNCKYNGGSNLDGRVAALADVCRLIPVCPEEDGGMRTPRLPSEISGGRVVNKAGEDVTAAFKAGAGKTLLKARENGCLLAVLKERSPSCGSGRIYDGTFTGALTEGDGVTAALLKRHGIAVFGESEIEKVTERLRPFMQPVQPEDDLSG